jgi:AraC-like DNA-binding protein
MLHRRTNTEGQDVYASGNRSKYFSDIYVRSIGELRSHGNFFYEKLNLELNVHLVLSGKGTLVYDDKTFYPQSGDVFVLFPHHYCCYYDSPASPWRYTWANIALPETSPILRNLCIQPDTPIMTPGEDSELWNIVRKAGKVIRSGSFSPLFPVKTAWDILEQLSINRQAENTPLAEKIKNRIDSSEYPPDVKALAEYFKVDRSTIFRAFKQRYDLPVKSYIDEIKFRNVCDLLKNTSFSIARIARLCGFGNQDYFSRAFKKRYGLPPVQWRNN